MKRTWKCMIKSETRVEMSFNFWLTEWFSMRLHGSHRSWHTFFKDFWGTFSRSFQGLFFVLSNISSQKIDKQWTFQIRHTETIWSWVRQRYGGGEFWVCVLTFFLDDLLYYGYNTASNNSAWKGGGVWGSTPRIFFIRISTKSCNSRQFWRVH